MENAIYVDTDHSSSAKRPCDPWELILTQGPQYRRIDPVPSKPMAQRIRDLLMHRAASSRQASFGMAYGLEDLS